MMFTIDLEMYFTLMSCAEYCVWEQCGRLFYSVQGKLQMACMGVPHVIDSYGDAINGPVFELAKMDPVRLEQITEINNQGRFDEAARKMLDFALESGVVQLAPLDMYYSKEFEKVLQQ